MPTTFRPAVEADIPSIVDIECRAFSRDTPESRAHKQRELQHELADYVALTDGPQIVAVARIQPHWLRVGCCQVLKGDVGHVAVPPELHGQGFGTTLMQRIIPHMRDHGFHLSRLGGLMKFYSRFGYEPFIRRYVHILVPHLDTPLKGQSWREMLDLPDAPLPHVRPYHPARDRDAVHRLRYAFDATRSGQIAIAPEPSGPATGEPDPSGLRWVYDDGQIRGFLQGAYALVNAGDPGPSYRLDELIFDYSCPQAVPDLVKTYLQRAQDEAPTKLTCRLPYDEALFNALSEANIACEVVEWRTANDGNMMLVVNLEGTLEAILPELQERLGGLPQLPWEGNVRFVLPAGEAILEVRGGEVGLTDSAADVVIRASQADFIKWLFGIVGFAESPQAQALTPPQRLVLNLLFPRLPCASGPWG